MGWLVRRAARMNILPRIMAFGLQFIFRFCLRQAVLLTAITAAAGLLPAVQVYVGKLLLDAMVAVFQRGATGPELTRLAWAFEWQFAVLLATTLMSQLADYLNFAAGKKLSLCMQRDVIERVIRLDFTLLDDPNFQDTMTRAQQECSGRPLSLLGQLTVAARGTITFLCLSGILLSFGWSLFLLSLLTCLPLLYIQLRYGQRYYRLQYERTEEQRRSGYYSGLLTSKSARAEVCSYGLFDFLFVRWMALAQRFLDQDFRLQRKQALAQMTLQALFALSSVGTMAYVVYVALVQRRNLTVGDVMMFSGAFSGATSAFRSVVSAIASVYQDSLFLENLRQFYQTTSARKPVRDGRAVPRIVESIEFENVSFTYPGRLAPALRNVNLTLDRAASTLLVGANGAGKTTLMKLLMRLYDPTEGRILLNGIDLREYDADSVRKSIGIIFQNFQLYAFTAGENIGCGCVERITDANRIAAAARRARAEEFILGLPNGYETPLTRMFTGGQDLSGGQWQRVCLARLFMKDSPVFIFDEPTASLDVEAEAALLEEIQASISSERLCVLISHRMLRAGIADHIVVLSHGTVLEEGTYDDLVARNGEFARLRRLFYRSSRMARLQETTP